MFVEQLKKDFVTTINNPMTLSPTFYLKIEEVKIDGKVILYINVPESSQVHRCKGKVFDRNEDGDLNITDNTTWYRDYMQENRVHILKIEFFHMLIWKSWKMNCLKGCEKQLKT